jgi:antitoxin VapB
MPTKTDSPLFIKNPRAHALAEELSRKLGISLTEAVIVALEEKVRRSKPYNKKRVDEILAKLAAIPIRDQRPEEQLLGYNEFGIPE